MFSSTTMYNTVRVGLTVRFNLVRVEMKGANPSLGPSAEREKSETSLVYDSKSALIRQNHELAPERRRGHLVGRDTWIYPTSGQTAAI